VFEGDEFSVVLVDGAGVGHCWLRLSRIAVHEAWERVNVDNPHKSPQSDTKIRAISCEVQNQETECLEP